MTDLPVSVYDIYVVVREDLQTGKAVAQVGHAVAGLVNQSYTLGYEKDAPDFTFEVVYSATEFGRMIVLGVPDLYELAWFGANLMPVFLCHGQPFRMFSFAEPDLNWDMTASAFFVHKTEQALFANLPLAFKEPEPVKRRWWQR